MIFVTVSTGHFDLLFKKCTTLMPKFSFFGQIGSGLYIPPFPFVRTVSPSQLLQFMRESELVISHAGTGMLSMLYHLKKPSVVVPKQKRYGESNDGQIELAKKWSELNSIELCMDLNNLEVAIENCRGRVFQFSTFPSLGRYFSESIF